MGRPLRIAIALALVAVTTIVAITSGLGARCLMMGRCSQCPEWVAANAPVAVIAAHPPCSAIAPAAPPVAPLPRADAAFIACAPAVVSARSIPRAAGTRLLAPASASPFDEAPPGGLVLRV